MTRRDYGGGAITERKHKNGTTVYQAQIRLPDGRRSETCSTEREAKAWLRRARQEATRGTLAAKRPPTFGAYLDQWLDGRTCRVKQRTIVSNRLNVRRVPDWLGGLRLDELRPRHFQRFYDELTAAGLAPRTVRQVHMTLHKALEDGLKLEAVTRNPTDGTQLPRIPRTEMHWYTNDQLAELFLATEGDDFHALWVVLGTLGLRISEALGLQWSDIDWRRNTISARRTVQRNRLTKRLEVEEMKTEGSRRTLTLPIETANALRAHRDRQDFKRKRAAEGWIDQALIFCTDTGGPLQQSSVHWEWKPAVAKSGLPRYRIHDLRHSVASNLIAAGMGLLEVAHFLGHANASMVTTVYGHIAPSNHQRAAAIMDGLLERHQDTVS